MRQATPADLKRAFDARGNGPLFWRSYTHGLLASSAALRGLWSAEMRGLAERSAASPDPQQSDFAASYHAAATMLRGTSCECLLKALGLERGKFRLAREGRFVSIRELGKAAGPRPPRAAG